MVRNSHWPPRWAHWFHALCLPTFRHPCDCRLGLHTASGRGQPPAAFEWCYCCVSMCKSGIRSGYPILPAEQSGRIWTLLVPQKIVAALCSSESDHRLKYRRTYPSRAWLSYPRCARSFYQCWNSRDEPHGHPWRPDSANNPYSKMCGIHLAPKCIPVQKSCRTLPEARCRFHRTGGILLLRR